MTIMQIPLKVFAFLTAAKLLANNTTRGGWLKPQIEAKCTDIGIQSRIADVMPILSAEGKPPRWTGSPTIPGLYPGRWKVSSCAG